ncbi:MAG: InlB B-repeat-containing protein [Treponema sp.]|nr:InlB B-repeat-containing protein [Treponema sp.]
MRTFKFFLVTLIMCSLCIPFFSCSTDDKNECTVTYRADGTTVYTQSVSEGDVIILKNANALNIFKTGYVFSGWQWKFTTNGPMVFQYDGVQDSAPYDILLPAESLSEIRIVITNDVTIDAEWAEQIYTANFNANGGTIATSTQ